MIFIIREFFNKYNIEKPSSKAVIEEIEEDTGHVKNVFNQGHLGF